MATAVRGHGCALLCQLFLALFCAIAPQGCLYLAVREQILPLLTIESRRLHNTLPTSSRHWTTPHGVRPARTRRTGATVDTALRATTRRGCGAGRPSRHARARCKARKSVTRSFLTQRVKANNGIPGERSKIC